MEGCKNNITFSAIKEFVEDLSSVFGDGGKSPLSLYSRLTKHVEDKDSTNGVSKYITGFKVFFANFESKLESKETIMEIPRGTLIRYGDSPKVYLEIQKYIYLSRNKPEQIEIIRKHLLTIAATIDPNEKSLAALDASPVLEQMGLGGGTAESRFVKDMMEKAKKSMADVEIDKENPTAAVMGLLSSGLITDMIKGLQCGVESKTLDPNKLLGGLQEALSGVMGSQGDGSGDQGLDVSRLVIATQQAMGSQSSTPQVEEVRDVD
jgi:hypothetical protein